MLKGGCREAAQRVHWSCTGSAGALCGGGAGAWEVGGSGALSLPFSLRSRSGLPLGLASKFLHMPNDNRMRKGWRTTVLLLPLLLRWGGAGRPADVLGFRGQKSCMFRNFAAPATRGKFGPLRFGWPATSSRLWKPPAGGLTFQGGGGVPRSKKQNNNTTSLTYIGCQSSSPGAEGGGGGRQGSPDASARAFVTLQRP